MKELGKRRKKMEKPRQEAGRGSGVGKGGEAERPEGGEDCTNSLLT